MQENENKLLKNFYAIMLFMKVNNCFYKSNSDYCLFHNFLTKYFVAHLKLTSQQSRFV